MVFGCGTTLEQPRQAGVGYGSLLIILIAGMTLLQKASSCCFLALAGKYPAQNPGFSIGPIHFGAGPFLVIV